MAVLLGNSVSEATTKAFIKEKPCGCRFEAQHTGTVEVIKVKLKATGATETKIDLGIYDDSAGAPGTLKAHKSVALASTAETTVEASGFSVAVVKGSFYHLASVSTTQTVTLKYKKEAGHEDLEKESTSWLELKEAGVWAKEAESLNLTIWAEGAEEEGAVKGKASGAMLLTGTASGTVQSVAKGAATGALLLTGTAKGTTAQRVAGKATGALLLAGTATGTVRALVAGKATGALLLTGTAKGAVAGGQSGKASGSMLLSGTASGVARNVVGGKATGTLTFTGAAAGAVRSTVTGRASGSLLFTGTAKGTASQGTLFGKATGTLVLSGTAKGVTRSALLIIQAGLVNPSSRAGVVRPLELAGVVNPRPGRLVKAGLVPHGGLFPKPGLFPGGDVIVPD